MEPAGLAVGLISLATTFDSVLNCFEYVHLGKNFGTDFEDCLLKLDNARLRLSRWGEAVGLSEVEEDTTSLKGTKISEADIPQAQKLLGGVLTQLKRVKTLEAEFKRGKAPNDASLAEVSMKTDVGSVALSLHEKMRKMAKRRQNNLSTRKKAKWALYDRRHFNDMIDSIANKTKELQELFPAAVPTERTLVDKETLELSESLVLLQNVIKEQDQALASALNAILKPVAEKVNNTVHGGNVGVMSAHRSDIRQSFGSS
ncbi:hypothetical protein CEP52_005525 [Fusarium oligoseptatum]|uniref:Prion-inhibition and propagation HeLo domain-containing protein n=1 Tax=Fusarium oligoseptatum TaxID=2604345 RepID=A0A428TXX6_9HYPO|nr:hypothetical protein CEP52_005525 [Fusarium oligoseptatum]